MILTDYYKGVKDPTKKTRFDVVAATSSYDVFERLLINKRAPKIGGLSFYFVDRPSHFKNKSQRQTDKAITKGTENISSIYIPDPILDIGYGNVKGTEDALIVLCSENWNVIELFISRGQKNNQINLYQICADGELDEEINNLRKQAELRDNQNCY